MLKTNNNRHEMVLRVRFEDSLNKYSIDRYYHIYGSLGVLLPGGYEVDRDFCKLSENYYCKTWLDCFRVSCQGGGMDGDIAAKDGLDGMYGHEVQYADLHSVDLRDVEMMYKLLRYVDRKLDAIRRDMGGTESTGHYFLRVCKALGIRKMAFKCTPEQFEFSGNRWRTTDLPGGQYAINQQIAEWIKLANERRKDVVA
jgi:hypothetical protein